MIKHKSFNRVLSVVMCIAMLMISAFATVTTASAKTFQGDFVYFNLSYGTNIGLRSIIDYKCYKNIVNADDLSCVDDGNGYFTISTNAVFDPNIVNFEWQIPSICEVLEGYSLTDTTCKLRLTINSGGALCNISACYTPNTNPTVSSSDNKTANVKYSVEPTYMVNIPATVSLNSSTTISAENVVLEKGKQVEVAIASTSEDDNSFKLKSAEGAEIEYTIQNNNSDVNLNTNVLTVNPDTADTGSSTIKFTAPSEVTYSGNYTGTITFAVSVNEA